MARPFKGQRPAVGEGAASGQLMVRIDNDTQQKLEKMATNLATSKTSIVLLAIRSFYERVMSGTFTDFVAGVSLMAAQMEEEQKGVVNDSGSDQTGE